MAESRHAGVGIWWVQGAANFIKIHIGECEAGDKIAASCHIFLGSSYSGLVLGAIFQIDFWSYLFSAPEYFLLFLADMSDILSAKVNLPNSFFSQCIYSTIIAQIVVVHQSKLMVTPVSLIMVCYLTPSGFPEPFPSCSLTPAPSRHLTPAFLTVLSSPFSPMSWFYFTALCSIFDIVFSLMIAAYFFVGGAAENPQKVSRCSSFQVKDITCRSKICSEYVFLYVC